MKLAQRWAIVTTLLLVAGVVIVRPAHADMQVDHRHPASGIAGDALVLSAEVVRGCGLFSQCPRPQLRVEYRDADGEPRRLSVTGNEERSQTLSVRIPGRDVRYPAFGYRLVLTAGDGTETAVPLTGEHSVPVANVLRIGLRYPGGAPAAGVRVIASPSSSGIAWGTVSDDAGIAKIAIPSADPRIATRAASDRSENIFVNAFDSWPLTEPNSDHPELLAGYGVDIGSVLNLGTALLPAVDPLLQDQTFVLEPQQRLFAAAAAPCVGNEFTACLEERTPLPARNLPLTNNLGGGSEMSSTYTYGNTVQTATTFMVNPGTGWAEAKGEITAEENQVARAVSSPIGPGANSTVYASFDFVKVKTSMCMAFQGCQVTYQSRPSRWNSGFFASPTPGSHDTARQMYPNTGSDCVVRHWGTYTSESSKGERLSYTVDVGGEFHNVSARTSFGKESSTSVVSALTWSDVGSSQPFHFRFVPNGFDATSEEKSRCPVSHPGLTWTDAATFDKTIDGPPQRHVINGINHGLYRTVNTTGPDRIHAWSDHDHGSKWAALSTCTTPLCDLNNPTRTFHCTASGSFAHMHCDAYSNDTYSSGLFITETESGGQAVCAGPPYTEGAAPAYADRHGIACHLMFEETSPGNAQ